MWWRLVTHQMSILCVPTKKKSTFLVSMVMIIGDGCSGLMDWRAKKSLRGLKGMGGSGHEPVE